MRYNIIQYNTIQYDTIQYNTIRYDTIRYNTRLPCSNSYWQNHHVTSPIWSPIQWLVSTKICIVGFPFVELEMDKTVHLKFLAVISDE